MPSRPLIRLARVRFAHPRQPALLDDVDVDLGAGWTAITGPNGAGKTTLLRLILGELLPSRGQVERHPGDAAIALCRQAPEALPEGVRAFGGDWSGRAGRLKSRWRLDLDALERWPTLSPGERQRWQIAAALAREPAVLLLDEPTNHLDAEGREALARELARFGGVGVVVAHDRAFLDALAARTVWIEDGRARAFDASWSEARAQMSEEVQAARHERASRVKEARRIEREREARRRDLARAETQRSAGKRSKGPRDSDGRSVARQERANRAAASHAKRAGAIERRAAEARARLDGARVVEPLGGAVAIRSAAGRGTPIRLALPALRRGDRTLLEPTSVVVPRGRRVWITGPNGAGKSTLLRAIAERLLGGAEPPLVLDQELDAQGRREAVERLRALPPEARGRALSRLAALGVDPARALASEAPSPGEARKMVLAEGLAREVSCALLDEPENHLDLPSVERIEEALRSFDGALVLVTHARRLGAALADEVWHIEDASLHRLPPPGEAS